MTTSKIAVAETKAAVAYGANEVDVVFPYRALIAATKLALNWLNNVKRPDGDITLKVIIETGELKKKHWSKASQICSRSGCKFHQDFNR